MSKKAKESRHIEEIRRLLAQEERGDEWPADLQWAWGALRDSSDTPPGAPAGEPPDVIEPEVGAALIAELIDRRNTDALTRLARARDKRVSKAARTALHRLRSLKVEVEVPRGDDRPAQSGTGQVQVQAAVSLASVYMGEWERELLLVEEAAGGGHVVIWAHVSAHHGLASLERLGASVPRRELRDMHRRLSDATLVYELPFSHVRWLLDDAIKLAKASGRSLPRGYTKAMTGIGPSPGGPHPAMAAPVADASVAELLALYDMEELRSWSLSREAMHRVVMRLNEVVTSRLMVDDQQRVAQIRATLDREAVRMVTPEWCAAARRVLLDTAHLALMAGNIEGAARLRAAANLMDEPPERLKGHPFVARFVARNFKLPEQMLRAADGRGDEPDAAAETDQGEAVGEAVSPGGLIIPGR